MAKDAMPSVGWATLVAVMAAAWAARASRPNAAGGNSTSAHWSPALSTSRSQPKATNRSAVMAGRWLPWPG